MNLEDKISLVDIMIGQDPDVTIKDFLRVESEITESDLQRQIKKNNPPAPPPKPWKPIFNDQGSRSFMFGYLNLLRETKQKYQPTEDTIISRPPPQYTNRSPYSILTEFLNDDHHQYDY